MASEQKRRENVTDERKIEVEKDRVPKMTTHFESLAVKAKGDEAPHVAEERTTLTVRDKAHDQIPHGGELKSHDDFMSHAGKVGGGHKISDSGHRVPRREKRESGSCERVHGESGGGAAREREQQQPSLEEISKLRGQAQQNSADAIRAAEERYQTANECRERVHGESGGGAASGREQQQQSLEEISKLRGQAQQNSTEAIRAAEERYQKAKELGASTLEKAKDTSLQGVQSAKDTLSSAGKTAADYTIQAKDYTAQKAMEAKDVIAEKTQGAKDTTMDTSKSAAGYIGEKAATAKDATVESGKGVAGYAGKVAGAVKDKAVVAGWGAAYYTAEMAAEATKKAADVTSSVAGYTGEKVAGATHTVAGFAGEKLAAVKDVVVSTEEKAAEYAARKKAEAERDSVKKSAAQDKNERGSMGQHERGPTTEEIHEHVKGNQQTEYRPFEKSQGYMEGEEGGGGEAGSVLQAIGETLVEIGQTTKDILVGQGPTTGTGRQHKGDEKEGVDEPFRGGGEGI